MRNEKLLQFTFILGLVSSVGVAILELFGAESCLTNSCEVVGSLSQIPTSWMFGCSGLYFAGLFILSRSSIFENSTKLRENLLLFGISAEAVLVNIQIYVAHAFCTTCLAIGVVILLSCMLSEVRYQALYSLIAVSLVFYIITIPISATLTQEALAVGTIGTNNKVSKAHGILIYSENCPHCRKVLNKLTTTTLRTSFNPTAQISETVAESLLASKNLNFDASVNTNLMQHLRLRSVPILILFSERNTQIIRGSTKILEILDAQHFASH